MTHFDSMTDVTAALQVEVLVEVLVDDETSVSPKDWDRWFQIWITGLAPTVSPINAYEMSLRLTDDQAIQQFNGAYRQQDRPTDVLAFAALEELSAGEIELRHHIPTDLGDIVISVETAVRQAQEYGHSLKRELVWLAAHGLLHLLGWDHPDDLSLERMLMKQAELLSWVKWDE